MDKYDYFEVIYRTVLYLIFFFGFGYFAFAILTAIAQSTNHQPDPFVFGIGTIIVAVYLYAMIGLAVYLIFVAKGTFRPAVYDDDDELPDEPETKTIPETKE